jgi:hypothetical protein
MNRWIPAFGMLLFLTLITVATSCHTPSRSRTTVILSNQPAKMPPGQAKKLYGQQSAKEFAPGQQKKKSGTTVVVRN